MDIAAIKYMLHINQVKMRRSGGCSGMFCIIRRNGKETAMEVGDAGSASI